MIPVADEEARPTVRRSARKRDADRPHESTGPRPTGSQPDLQKIEIQPFDGSDIHTFRVRLPKDGRVERRPLRLPGEPVP